MADSEGESAAGAMKHIVAVMLEVEVRSNRTREK
jgi:hypothetical protein